MFTRTQSRDLILERAGELASRVGLASLTVGGVARELGWPKSTVYSHFQSLERLQLRVLESAAQELLHTVIRPALQAPDGVPRLARLLDRWLEWDGEGTYPGGCLFAATASEFDDRPGRVRDRLVRLCFLWRQLVGGMVDAAIHTGAFTPGLDRGQFVHDFDGILLGYHHATRLLQDPDAEWRARTAFRGLVRRAGAGRERTLTSHSPGFGRVEAI